VKVLLSDGSGATARQVAARLAESGHHVEVLSPEPLCLCRFTRHVRRVHRVPAYGADPLGWLDAALATAAAGGFDVLFPTQEQVAVLSHSAARLADAGVRTAVPSFAAVRAVQDKISAWATLGALGIPQPRTALAGSADALRQWPSLPAYVKLPVATASTGVRLVASTAALRSAADELQAAGVFAGGGVIVQQPAAGPLVMAQSVFARGELVAAHACLRVREGASGGASHKRSLAGPEQVVKHLETLGRSLQWHGGLSADAILTEDGPVLIDVNPRLVEPGNAWRAGVDLTGALLDVACGGAPDPQPPGRPAVTTHQLLLALLGAGAHGHGRRGVAAELFAALARRGLYRGSAEELTPARGDPIAAVPVLFTALAMLARPALWRWFAGGSVDAYALTPAAWDALLTTPGP
jgi:biotin carboxylase